MGREGNHRNAEEGKNFVLSKKVVSKKLKIEQSVLVVENIIEKSACATHPTHLQSI